MGPTEAKPSLDSALAMPLVGREEELAALDSALDRGGCLISGATGVGKSRLAEAAAARRAENGSHLERVACSAAAAELPLGPFAHLLPADADDRIPPTRAIVAELARRAAGRRPILVVDDAHCLDRGSAGIVLQLALTTETALLVTARQGEALPDSVSRLWRDEHLGRLDLQPLSRQESDALVFATLGRPEPMLARRVFELSDGNPLFVRELLAAAISQGALAGDPSGSGWDGTLRIGERLGEIVDARLGALSEAASRALELASLAGALSVSDIEALVGPDGLEELQRVGLVEIRRDGERDEVAPVHGIYAEAAIEALPVATARRHRRALAERFKQKGGRRGGDLPRLAVWELDGGGEDAELFLSGALAALRAGDAPLARRLAGAAGEGLDAAIVAARALTMTNEFVAAEALLARHGEAAREAGAAAGIEYAALRVLGLHWGCGDVDAATELLDEVAGWHAGVDWGAQVAILRAWLLIDAERPADAAALLDRLVPEALSPRVRLGVLVAQTLARCRRGDSGFGEQVEPQLQALAAEIDDGSWDVLLAPDLVAGGPRLEAARGLSEIARRFEGTAADARSSGHDLLSGMAISCLGRIALLRGHAASAQALLGEAAAYFSATDPRSTRGLMLALQSRAISLTGCGAEAREVLDAARAEAALRPRNPRLAFELERAEAWALVAEGDLSTAVSQLESLAASCEQDLLNEAAAWHDVGRLSDPGRGGAASEHLRRIAADCDNDRIGAAAMQLQALAERDARAASEAGEALAGLELDLVAAEAFSAAAMLFRDEGRESSARTAAARAASLAAACGDAVTPLLGAIPAADDLTRREREVATLVARGLSNSEVAERLVLSVRTVESHVYKACGKLGVHRRDKLAALLGARGSETGESQ